MQLAPVCLVCTYHARAFCIYAACISFISHMQSHMICVCMCRLSMVAHACMHLVFLKVNTRVACNLAAAFMQEYGDAHPGHAKLKSSRLLLHMQRLRKTQKESNPRLLIDEDLQAPCPITLAEIGLKEQHPILQVEDFLRMLSDTNNLSWLTGGRGFEACATFWERYHHEDCNHPAFSVHGGRLAQVVPVYIYGDEGTSHKRNQLLVLSVQPVLGQGTSFTADQHHADDLQVNMLGVSIKTRFLYTVLMARLYQRKPAVFDSLMEVLATELVSLFYNGIQLEHGGKPLVLYPAAVGCKGDWPMLKKMGSLKRSHHGGKAEAGKGKGVCHLCMAGTAEFPDWHDVINGSWMCDRSIRDPDVPWLEESPLTATIPQSVTVQQQVWFYRPDLFHTCHKGLMAELAGSALATGQKSSARMCSNRFLFFQSIHIFVDHPVQPIPFSSPQHRLQGEHVGLEPRYGRWCWEHPGQASQPLLGDEGSL